MAIEDELFAALDGHAGLTALVVSRIYPIKANQSATYPLLVYQRISNSQYNGLSGSSGLANSRYQISAYADTYASARAVADQVVLAMAAATVTSILKSRIDTDFDDVSDKYRVILDFSVWHT